MAIPKSSQGAKAAFQTLLPPDSSISIRPMFGNLSAFVNGNMFSGVFGEDLFVRVSAEDQAKIKKQGGRPFEPMPGRPMTGYVLLPAGWQKKGDASREWVRTALAFTGKLPAKAAKKTSRAKAAAAKTAAGRSR